MKKSTIAIIISVVALITIGGIVYLATQDSKSTSTASETTTNANTTETNINDNGTEQEATTTQPESSGQASGADDGTYTAAEVATHNTESDCWTIIDGSVYDITSYVPRHPGGDEILLACGTDGSSLFNQRKTSSGEDVGSGTAHSSAAQSQLAQLKIGDLTQN